MITQQIQQLINQASQYDNSTSDLSNHLQDVLSAQGVSLNERTMEQAVQLVANYINQVPAVFEQTINIADSYGELENIAPLLQSAANYFFNPMDYIPDHLGLYGLLDDAYLTLRMLEKMNQTYVTLCGQFLLPFDLSPINNSVRPFLGSQLATQLDREVTQAVEQRAYEVSAMETLSQRHYNSGGQQTSPGTQYFEDDAARFFNDNNIIVEYV